MNCKVSHIVVSYSRPKVSLSRICCRGQGHQHAFSVYNLQKIHSCRNRYHAVCAKMRDAASTDDGSRSLEIRSRDGGFNGASNHNSFNRLEVDIAEVTHKSNLLGMKSSFPSGSAHEILMQYTSVIVNVSFSV